MSGSVRGKRTPLVEWVFPIIGLTLAIGLAWGLGYLQARETELRYYTTRAYQESAKSHARRACVGLEPVAAFECIDKHVEAAYEQSNAEQNLSAQQRASTSALLSAIVSFLALIATGIGLFYVRETLMATLKAVEDTSEATDAMRESNRIAQDNARRQLRAYVSVSPGELSLDVVNPREHKVTLALVFRNGGATPAYQFQHGGNIVVFQPERARAYFTEGYKTAPITGEGSQLTLHTQQDHHGVIESMRLITSAEFDQLQKGNASLYAYGFASYQDNFGVSYTTRFCYELEPADFRKSVGARDESGEAPVVWTFPAFHNGAD